MQDGTPTPDAPVYIGAVRSPHRFPGSDANDATGIGRTNVERWGRYNGSSTKTTIRPDGTVEQTFSGQWHGIGLSIAEKSPFAVDDVFHISCSFRNDSTVAASVALYAMQYNSAGTRVYTGNPVEGSNSISLTAIEPGAVSRQSFKCTWTQGCQDILDAGGYVSFTFQFTNSSSTGGSIAMYNPMLSMGATERMWIKENNIAVVSRTKNLLKLPTWAEISACRKYSSYYYKPIFLEPNTTYHLNTLWTDVALAKQCGYILVANDPANTNWKAIAHTNSGYSNANITTDADGILYLTVYASQEQYESMLANAKPQLEEGGEATDYEPYRESVAYIDLKGEEADYIDDDYGDTLSADASGHVLLHKRCGRKTIAERDGGGRYAAGVYWVRFNDILHQDVTSGTAHDNTHPLLSTNFVHTTGDATVWTSSSLVGYFTRHAVAAYPSYNHEVFYRIANDLTNAEFCEQYADVEVVYPLDEPYTIDLGYIEPPITFDGGSVRVIAEIQPVIDASWWTKAGELAGQAHNNQLDYDKRVEQNLAAQKPYIVGTQTAATYD